MKKECVTCGRELNIELFPFRGGSKNTKRNGNCIDCKREYDRNYHNKRSKVSKEKKLVNQQIYRDTKKLQFIEIKSKLFCKDCGESRTPILDFHHRNPAEKDNSIGQMLSDGFSIKSILKEIEKCDVLCSNCHRMLHSEE